MEEGALKRAVDEGISSLAYTTLLITLCLELKDSLGLEEGVTPPQGSEDSTAFQMELRGVLAELNCPHISLTTDMSLLSSPSNRLLVLEYLVSEVLAARLSAVRGEEEEAMEVNGEEVRAVCVWGEGEGSHFFPEVYPSCPCPEGKISTVTQSLHQNT